MATLKEKYRDKKKEERTNYFIAALSNHRTTIETKQVKDEIITVFDGIPDIFKTPKTTGEEKIVFGPSSSIVVTAFCFKIISFKADYENKKTSISFCYIPK